MLREKRNTKCNITFDIGVDFKYFYYIHNGCTVRNTEFEKKF